MYEKKQKKKKKTLFGKKKSINESNILTMFASFPRFRFYDQFFPLFPRLFLYFFFLLPFTHFRCQEEVTYSFSTLSSFLFNRTTFLCLFFFFTLSNFYHFEVVRNIALIFAYVVVRAPSNPAQQRTGSMTAQ